MVTASLLRTLSWRRPLPNQCFTRFSPDLDSIGALLFSSSWLWRREASVVSGRVYLQNDNLQFGG